MKWRPTPRAQNRLRVLLGGELEKQALSRSCTILDLSVQGARVRTPMTLEVGDPVSLTPTGHDPFPGVVVWTERGQAGVHFIDIPPRNLKRWGDRARVFGLG